MIHNCEHKCCQCGWPIQIFGMEGRILSVIAILRIDYSFVFLFFFINHINFLHIPLELKKKKKKQGSSIQSLYLDPSHMAFIVYKRSIKLATKINSLILNSKGEKSWPSHSTWWQEYKPESCQNNDDYNWCFVYTARPLPGKNKQRQCIAYTTCHQSAQQLSPKILISSYVLLFIFNS